MPRVPTTKSTKKARKEKTEKTEPKPPNPWVLYHSTKGRELYPPGCGVSFGERAKAMSRLWKLEPPEVRQYWTDQAELLKKQHAQKKVKVESIQAEALREAETVNQAQEWEPAVEASRASYEYGHTNGVPVASCSRTRLEDLPPQGWSVEGSVQPSSSASRTTPVDEKPLRHQGSSFYSPPCPLEPQVLSTPAQPPYAFEPQVLPAPTHSYLFDQQVLPAPTHPPYPSEQQVLPAPAHPPYPFEQQVLPAPTHSYSFEQQVLPAPTHPPYPLEQQVLPSPAHPPYPFKQQALPAPEYPPHSFQPLVFPVPADTPFLLEPLGLFSSPFPTFPLQQAPIAPQNHSQAAPGCHQTYPSQSPTRASSTMPGGYQQPPTFNGGDMASPSGRPLPQVSEAELGTNWGNLPIPLHLRRFRGRIALPKFVGLPPWLPDWPTYGVALAM